MQRLLASVVVTSLAASACVTDGDPIDTGLSPATQAVLDSCAAQPAQADVFVVNTASQDMPASIVVDGADDAELLTLSYPSFVLRYPKTATHDERIVLIDAGFTEQAAHDFGAGIQRMVWAAKPMQFHTGLDAALGDDVNKVELALFTHLHADHVVGLQAVCRTRSVDDKVVAFLPWAQADYGDELPGTGAGWQALMDMPCTDPIRAAVPDGAFTAVDDKRYPGLYVMRVAGHTPGTQVVLAHTTKGWLLFAGDVVNAVDAYLPHEGEDDDTGRPKPLLYRALVVPEDERVLKGVRRALRDLHDDVTIVVSHDEAALNAAEMQPYPTPR